MVTGCQSILVEVMTLIYGKWLIAFILILIFSSCSGVTVTVGYNGPVTEHSEARLTCDYNSSIGAPPSFRWKELVNGSPVLISLYQSGFGSVEPDYRDRFSVEGDSTLVITNNSRSDNGRIYQCQVTVVGDSPPDETDELTLSVVFFGTIMFDIISSPVTEGGSVMFVCYVNANPDPVINLYKDETTEIISETTTNLTYKIAIVEKTDGGNYKCEASNTAGSDVSQVKQLDVQYEPEYELEDKQNVGRNEQLNIELEVSANPSDVTYKWTTEPPGIGDEDTNQATFTVSVADVNVTMFTITVNVTNSIGSTVKMIEITVVDCVCENGGTCEDGKCICPEGFKGPKCEVSDDDTNVIVIIFATLGGCVVLVGISFGGHRVYKSKNSKKPPNDPTSDPVVPQDDVEMKQPDSNSDLKRYAASGGDLYTQVSLKDKKKKPDCDNGSNKPTAVDLNVEGLQYADLDLTRNLPTDKKNVIHHPDQETTYSSIQLQPQQI